jgi:hypothetical protein
MVSVSLLFFVQIKKYMIKKNGFVGIGRLFGASVYRDISFESRGSGNFFSCCKLSTRAKATLQRESK